MIVKTLRKLKYLINRRIDQCNGAFNGLAQKQEARDRNRFWILHNGDQRNADHSSLE